MTTPPRTFVLGGEIASRNLLGVAKPVLACWGVTLGLAVGLYFSTGGGGVGGAGAAMLIGAVLALTGEWSDQPSIAARRLHRLRDRLRRRAGEHVYRNLSDPAYGDPTLDPGWEFPVPLGVARPLKVAGTGLDDMFIVRHANPGERTYFSVLLAVEGVSGGLRGDAAYSATSSAFGTFMANMAKSSSFVRGVQLVHRSVPHDMAPHARWIDDQVSRLDDERLRPAVESYGALLDVITPLAEEHRSYVALKVPQTDRFMAATGRLMRAKGASIEGAIAQVVRDETERAARLLALAGMGRVEVYGERRACAVFRAFIDPRFKLARHADADWAGCWPTYVGGVNSVAIGSDSRWRTRVGFIPPRAIEPVELGPLWLAPLLTGVEADPGDDDTPPLPTIRTISVRMDFVHASKARQVARGDATADTAQQIKEARKGKTTDGSSEVMASASQRRRQDLMPGSGHHGVIYSMAVAVTGRDDEDVDRACVRVTEATNESALTQIDWMTDNHDVGLFATLPLGRGLAQTKYTR